MEKSSVNLLKLDMVALFDDGKTIEEVRQALIDKGYNFGTVGVQINKYLKERDPNTRLLASVRDLYLKGRLNIGDDAKIDQLIKIHNSDATIKDIKEYMSTLTKDKNRLPSLKEMVEYNITQEDMSHRDGAFEIKFRNATLWIYKGAYINPEAPDEEDILSPKEKFLMSIPENNREWHDGL